MPRRTLRPLLAALTLLAALPSAARAQRIEAYRAIEFFGLSGGEEPPADGGPDDGEPDAGPDSDAGPGDGSGPSVAFVQPADGDEVSGQVMIEVEASDEDGVARVEFFIDDMARGGDGEPPYQHLWQTASYAGGTHTVRAVAFDSLDTPTEAAVTVTVAGEAEDGDRDAGSGGEGEQEPARYDPISWGCSAAVRGRGCGLATALGLALVLAALARARGGAPDRARLRRRRTDAQFRDGG